MSRLTLPYPRRGVWGNVSGQPSPSNRQSSISGSCCSACASCSVYSPTPVRGAWSTLASKAIRTSASGCRSSAGLHPCNQLSCCFPPALPSPLGCCIFGWKLAAVLKLDDELDQGAWIAQVEVGHTVFTDFSENRDVACHHRQVALHGLYQGKPKTFHM